METNEIQEDTLVEESVDEEVTDAELAEAEDAEVTEEVEEESDTTDWKAEALKYKAIAIRNKKKSEVNSNINSKLQTKAENPGDDTASRIASLEVAEKKRQFGYKHGLSPLETDAVFKIDTNPTQETLKDPFLKGGLEAIRSQERLSKNMPSTSAKSTTLDRKKLKDLIIIELI